MRRSASLLPSFLAVGVAGAAAVGAAGGCSPVRLDAVDRASLPESLLANWSFDEGQGLVAHDRGRGGRHATLSDFSPWWADARFGAAALRPRRGNAAFATVDPFPSLGGQWTLSAWLRYQSDDLPIDTGTAVGAQAPGAGGWALEWSTLAGAFEIRFWVIASSGGAPVTVAARCCAFEPLRWYHVVAVVDRAAGRVSLFESGVLQSDVALPGPVLAGTSALVIGRPGAGVGAGGAGQFEGELDEIALFDRALGDDEVRTLDQGPQAY